MNLTKSVVTLALLAVPFIGAVKGVTVEVQSRPQTESSEWLTYSGDYDGRRHATVGEITPTNVNKMKPLWTFQTDYGYSDPFEATPLLVGDTLYVSGSANRVWAIDARTGRRLWRYTRPLLPGLKLCCGMVNRGLAVLGTRLFMATLDASLVALDARNGEVLFDVPLGPYEEGYSATGAPLVVGNKVIVGIAGGEYPIRGFIDAYDAISGARVWRFYTIPGVGEQGADTWPNTEAAIRGGGSAWVTGTYDPGLNTVYWGVGNPSPDLYGDKRMGDNLYTNSVVALDADSGRLRWHFQFTPHDTHDWDSTHVPVLGEVRSEGVMRKVVMIANRNGFFYVLDRRSGELLRARPFTGTQWAREVDSRGRPIVLEERGTEGRCIPDTRGGTSFMPPSYDPARQLFFVTARESCAIYTPLSDDVRPGQHAMGGYAHSMSPPWGALRAIRPETGEVMWEVKYGGASMAGVLSTKTGLVFTGDDMGNFIAFNSSDGRRLWHYQLGANIYGAAAMSAQVKGKQYVVVAAGTTLTAFGLPEEDVRVQR